MVFVRIRHSIFSYVIEKWQAEFYSTINFQMGGILTPRPELVEGSFGRWFLLFRPAYTATLEYICRAGVISLVVVVRCPNDGIITID